MYRALFLAALLLGMWLTERRSLDPVLARKTYLSGAASGIVGARLWYAAQYGWTPGLSFYGFAIGAFLGASSLHIWRHRGWPESDFPDAAAPAVAVGLAIHRLGCFFSGCCFGKVCQLPWGVRYGAGTDAFGKQVADGLIEPTSRSTLPIHPTQLYESVAMIGAFLVLIWLPAKWPSPLLRYEPIFGLAIYYSTSRFVMEFIRDDAGGRHFGPLTFSQGTSIGCLLIALYFVIARRQRYRKGDYSIVVKHPNR